MTFFQPVFHTPGSNREEEDEVASAIPRLESVYNDSAKAPSYIAPIPMV